MTSVKQEEETSISRNVPDIAAKKGTATGREGCRQSRKGEQEERTVQHHRPVGLQML